MGVEPANLETGEMPLGDFMKKNIFTSSLIKVPVFLGLMFSVGSFLAFSPEARAEAFNDEQTKSIKSIVRDYLLKHPEILMDMQASLEKKMETARAKQMEKSLVANADVLFRSKNAAIAGNPKGDVTVVEFFDYNCGYCKRALEGITKLIDADKNIKVIFKELPIFGKESEDAARVALAARNQGKYWEVHNDLLKSQGRSNEAKALRIAKKHGLDMTRIKADMKSEAITGEIEETKELAQSMGINGTPHFFVGNRMIPGAPDDLLEQILAHAASVRKDGCKFC